MADEEPIYVSVGRSFKELHKKIGTIPDLQNFIIRNFNLPSIQLIECSNGVVAIANLFDGVPDDVQSQDHESFDEINKLLCWISGSIEISECSYSVTPKMLEEMPQPTENEQIYNTLVPTSNEPSDELSNLNKHSDQGKMSVFAPFVVEEFSSLTYKPLTQRQAEKLEMNELSNQIARHMLDEMPEPDAYLKTIEVSDFSDARSLLTVNNEFAGLMEDIKELYVQDDLSFDPGGKFRVDLAWNFDVSSDDDHTRNGWLVHILGLSFDPGGKHDISKEAKAAKEGCNPIAHQVFVKMPKSISNTKVEGLVELIKGSVVARVDGAHASWISHEKDMIISFDPGGVGSKYVCCVQCFSNQRAALYCCLLGCPNRLHLQAAGASGFYQDKSNSRLLKLDPLKCTYADFHQVVFDPGILSCPADFTKSWCKMCLIMEVEFAPNADNVHSEITVVGKYVCLSKLSDVNFVEEDCKVENRIKQFTVVICFYGSITCLDIFCFDPGGEPMSTTNAWKVLQYRAAQFELQEESYEYVTIHSKWLHAKKISSGKLSFTNGKFPLAIIVDLKISSGICLEHSLPQFPSCKEDSLVKETWRKTFINEAKLLILEDKDHLKKGVLMQDFGMFIAYLPIIPYFAFLAVNPVYSGSFYFNFLTRFVPVRLFRCT